MTEDGCAEPVGTDIETFAYDLDGISKTQHRLLGAISEALKPTPYGQPDFVYPYHGAGNPPAELGSASRLIVSLQSSYAISPTTGAQPTFQNPERKRELQWVAELSAVLYRPCWPMVENDGRMPSVDEITKATHNLNADLRAVQCHVLRHPNDWITADGDCAPCSSRARYLPGQARPMQNAGGVAGWRFDMTVQIADPCCAQCEPVTTEDFADVIKVDMSTDESRQFYEMHTEGSAE